MKGKAEDLNPQLIEAPPVHTKKEKRCLERITIPVNSWCSLLSRLGSGSVLVCYIFTLQSNHVLGVN